MLLLHHRNFSIIKFNKRYISYLQNVIFNFNILLINLFGNNIISNYKLDIHYNYRMNIIYTKNIITAASIQLKSLFVLYSIIS